MPLNFAICGCTHGELDTMYEMVGAVEKSKGVKIDFLLCCGDFESVRHADDLSSVAVPAKYRDMKTFHKYYTGVCKAPVLTIFIGGNHEASNYLWQLPYGGWIAPNIYYAGRAGVLNVCGVRVASLSGIYKAYDYLRGVFEMPPFSEEAKRSIYHVRALDAFRLKLLRKPVDIFLSHDWPRGIYQFGDRDSLLQQKPFFLEEMDNGQLGSLPLFEILKILRPDYWFAAHMHVRFAALVPHDDDRLTRFLALDKCLPSRQFFQLLQLDQFDSPTDDKGATIQHDAEWMGILKKTDHLVQVTADNLAPPQSTAEHVAQCQPNDEELEQIVQLFSNSLDVPVVDKYGGVVDERYGVELNSQTSDFCEKLQIRNLVTLLLASTRDDDANKSCEVTAPVVTSSEICLDDDDAVDDMKEA